MIWTLLAFGITLYLLNKLAFPRIAEALDRRRQAIEDSIEAAQRAKQEADELLEEYRARLREAREQAEDIVARARKAAESLADETKAQATQAARGAAGGRAPRHRARDAPRARGDPQGGRRPHGDGHREGHAQVAHRRGPPPPDRGGAQRGRLLGARRDGRERPRARWRRSPRSTRARCSRSPRSTTSLDRVHDELGEFADALDEDRNLQVFLFSPYFSSEEKKRRRAQDRERRRRALRELPRAARGAPPDAGAVPHPARVRRALGRGEQAAAGDRDERGRAGRGLVERHRQAHRGADRPHGRAVLERGPRRARRPDGPGREHGPRRDRPQQT